MGKHVTQYTKINLVITKVRVCSKIKSGGYTIRAAMENTQKNTSLTPENAASSVAPTSVQNDLIVPSESTIYAASHNSALSRLGEAQRIAFDICSSGRQIAR